MEMNIQKVSGFLQELNDLKGKNQKIQMMEPSQQKLILERKLKELTQKEVQISEEIEREVEDFFSYLQMKQASIETLKNIGEYVATEITKLKEQINSNESKSA